MTGCDFFFCEFIEDLCSTGTFIPDDFMYQPIKVTVDSAGYTYVLSDGSYYGAILYAPSGKFLGFYGANSVKNTVTQFIAKMWKKLTSTNAKRSASASRLPYQFTDLYADKDNFIYTATGKTSQTLQTGQIRQLSPGGIRRITPSAIIMWERWITSSLRRILRE